MQTPYRPLEQFSTQMLIRVAVRNPKGKLIPELDQSLQAELAIRRIAERRKLPN